MSVAARTTVGAIALIAIVGLYGPASAQPSENWARCANKEQRSLDLQIGGCTAVIQSGKEANDNLAVAFYHRGTAYRLKDDNERAIADYNEAMRLNPKYTDAFFSRAYVYRSKGDVDRALADLDAVIRLDPKHVNALYSRGFAYHAKGDYDRAIADYDQVIKLGSKFGSDAFTYRGNSYFAKKAFDRAIADYDAALKIDPRNPGPLYARGVSRKKKGDAGGDVDIAAALAIRDFVGKQFEGYGVKQ